MDTYGPLVLEIMNQIWLKANDWVVKRQQKVRIFSMVYPPVMSDIAMENKIAIYSGFFH